MQVKCPGCKSAYKVDDNRIPDTGLKMRCPKCQTAFKVVKRSTPPITKAKPAAPPPVKPSKSRLQGISPKRPVSAAGVLPSPSGPAMPSVPMPEPPQLQRKAPPPPLPKNNADEFDIVNNLPRESDASDLKNIDLDLISESSDLTARESPRPPAVTGEFDPLAPLSDDAPPSPLNERPDLWNEKSPTPSSESLSDMDSLSGDIAKGEPPELSDSFNLSDVDKPPQTEENPDFISLPPISTPPFQKESVPNIQGDENAPVDVNSIPALAIVENTVLTNDDTLPMRKGEDFEEIDFDSTLAKSDAFDMHLTDDLDLEPPSVKLDTTPLESTDEDISNFGSVGIPSLEPLPAGAVTESSPPSNALGDPPSLESMPPALSAFDIDENSDMDSIPSPADLLGGPPPPTPGNTPSSDRIDSRGSTDFGEISLSPGENGQDEIPDLDDGAEFDAFPTQTNPEVSSSDSRIDLAADPMDLRTKGTTDRDSKATTDRRPTGAFGGRRKLARQSRRVRLVALLCLLVIVAGGLSLSYTDFGPFGANFIYRLIPKTVDKGVVTHIEKRVAGALRDDTYKAISAALSESHKGYQEYPGSTTLQLLTVYLCYLKQIRFGIDATSDKIATEVLGTTRMGEATSPYAPLASVAQAIRFARELPVTPALISSLKKTPDGTALLAELYLSQHKPNDAVPIAEALDAKEHSARSGYLLGRSLLKTTDDKRIADTIVRLETFHKSFPKHPDIALVLAGALIRKKETDTTQISTLIDTVLSRKNPPLQPIQKAEAHALKATLLIEKREYKTAEEEIARSEKLNPDNLTLSLAKGRVALKRKDLSTAEMAFNKALAEEPDNKTAVLGKLETKFRSGEFAATQKALTAFIKKHKDNAYAHYLLGEIEAALEGVEPAIKSLQTALELDDALLEAYIALSTIYITQEQNQKAMEILDQASERFTQSPLIKKTLATAHAARGDFAAAIIELDNAIKLDTEDVEAYYMMGQMYREMKSFEDALNALKEVEKRNPDYPGLALEQGRVLEFSGRVDKALSAYKKALSQSPNNTSLKLRVGVASHLIGDMETAKKQLLSVLEETPSSPEANFYLGEIHRISGTVTEGIVHLQKACDLDPDNALYKLRYGLALKDLGENTKAMAALQEAIKRDPKMAEAYVAIGQIRLIQGGPRDAIYWVERGLQFNPNLKQGYITVAEAYEQISKMSSAAHYYRKASEVDPENATVHFKLGMAEMTVHGQKSAAVPLGKAVALVEKQTGAKPHWYPEALYRLGVAEKARGQRAAAIAAFKRYLEVAPENHIDRFEVRANLDELEH